MNHEDTKDTKFEKYNIAYMPHTRCIFFALFAGFVLIFWIPAQGGDDSGVARMAMERCT